MRRVVSVMALALVIAVPAAFGEDNESGRYATRNLSTDSTDLANGGRVDVVHHQATFADQPDHPLDNTVADCVGMYRITPDGTLGSASGSCFSRSASGDGTSYWWRFEKQGTADCPGLCGTWGFYDGFGKFKGISGTGTWQQTADFGDGGMGTWTATTNLK